MSDPVSTIEPRPSPADLPPAAVVRAVCEGRPDDPLRAGPTLRALCLGIAAACLFVLYTAGTLRPDPSGMGTHRQLGLAGCGFLSATGMPCMSCGMTTAFAHTARGELIAATAAQPMGAALALACVAATVLGTWTALTGHVWRSLYILLPSQRFWYCVLAFWIGSWVFKALMVRWAAG